MFTAKRSSRPRCTGIASGFWGHRTSIGWGLAEWHAGRYASAALYLGRVASPIEQTATPPHVSATAHTKDSQERRALWQYVSG